MKFYLGTHKSYHIGRTDVDLFLSIRELRKRKHKPFKQTGRVFVDSGGFSELSMFGKWETTPHEYATELLRLKNKLGLKIEWASCQDWMVENAILKKTGLTIREHQSRTIQNYLLMLKLMEGSGIDIIPVLQGQTIGDYLDHIKQYSGAGVQLKELSIVGVGSVCRREFSHEVGSIIRAIFEEGISIHGFGVKQRGLIKYGSLLVSADSMAWSYRARYGNLRCTLHSSRVGRCNNCLNFALEWRDKLLRAYGSIT